MNGDGIPDAATSNTGNFLQTAPRVSVMFGRADGTLGPPTAYVTAKAAEDIVAADFDGDGDVDLVTSDHGNTWDGASVSLLRNRGDGFGAPTTLEALVTGGDFSPALEITDIDRDGDRDIIYTDLKMHEEGLGSHYAVAIYRNDGAGGFGAPETVRLGGTTGGFCSVRVADVNDDGHLDLITASHTIEVALGHGDLTFADPVAYGSNLLPANDATLGDFDGDGRIDVAVGISENSVTGDGIDDLGAMITIGSNASAMAIVPGREPDVGVPGDATGDRVVDFADVLAVLSAWGVCEGDCPEDLDGNGIVEFSDLLIVLANWS